MFQKNGKILVKDKKKSREVTGYRHQNENKAISMLWALK